jgi:hypothetical protein
VPEPLPAFPTLSRFPSRTTIESIRQPLRPRLVSLASRKRRITVCPAAEAGRLTTVSMKPPELPDQARRPEIGLPHEDEIVAV